MDDAVRERVRRYILDGGSDEERRLLRISELTAGAARAAFEAVGIGDGWRALDCGCGPIGALAVMAGAVGPSGAVVGVDFSETTVERARAVAAELGLANVRVVAGDVNAPGIGAVTGEGFDLAFTRCFLMHQADPADTLARIAGLLRPGGWIVAHEPLRTPPPRSQPEHHALAGFWELMHRVMERAGAQPLAVERLAGSARAAGLEVVADGGFFVTLEPAFGFDLHAGTLAATRARAVESGLASAAEVDRLIAELHAAADAGCEWVTTPFLRALTLRRPTVADGP